MKRYGIRQYVAWITLIPMIVITACVEAFFLHRYFSEIDLHIVDRGKLISSQLEASSEYGVVSSNLPFLQNITQSVLHQQDVRGVMVLNSASRILAESGDFSNPVKGVIADMRKATPGSLPAVTLHNDRSLLIYQSITPETVKLDEFETAPAAKPVGAIILEISLERIEKAKSETLWYTIAATAAFLALASFIIYLASRRITRPISLLSNTVRAIGQGNLEARAAVFTHMDELGALSHGINHMAEHLQHEHVRLRQRVDDATQSIRESKEKAEQANRAKTKFLANASHDLRQPIHAQGLFLEVLSHTGLSEYQHDLLTNARAASKASGEMLDTLLDYSRIEAGIIEPRLQPFRLQPLLNKVENELAPQADEKGIVYRTRETLLVARSDPALVELILRNLVSNAIRYTARGGLLVACRKHGDQAMLEVWDTGIGIAPWQQQDVFREFYQLGNLEQDRNKGLGLGLAIAQGLARVMGHELSLASTPQRGSVFRLALPITSDPLPGEQVELARNTTQLPNTRVLVIDDDVAVLAGMCHLLRDWGCECDTAESIEQALPLARAHAPNVVISDYRLREQHNGLEAIAALRELLGDSLPALLITGDTAPKLLREALASGIPLLHKPVSPGQLYRNLVEVLEAFSRRDNSGLAEKAGS